MINKTSNFKQLRITSIVLFIFLQSFLNVFSQNGKILSKTIVNLTKTPIWSEISTNDTLKNEYKHLNTLNFYFITYESDSLKVNGILVEPKKNDTYPVVIFNRGGNRDFSSLTVATMIMLTSKLAAQGYIIIGSNYRKKDEFGGAEINDVLNLTQTIKELEKADTNNIGMFGWSRGGMMTYLALQKTDKIKTAIIGNGVSNLFEEINFRPEMETRVFAECIPNYWANKKNELEKRSVIFWANELNQKSSLLILCGTKDDRVNPKQSDDIGKKLKEIGYDFELQKFETDHYFSEKRTELNELVIKWFNEKLKNID